MNRIIFMIIFLAVALTVLFGLHFFVFRFFSRSLHFSASTAKYLKIFFWCSGLSFIVGMLLSRGFKIHFLIHYAYIWLGVIAISFAVTLIARLVTVVFPALTRVSALSAAAAIGVLIFLTLFNGYRSPTVKDVTVPINGLSEGAAGFTIVQVSDLHMEAYKSEKNISSLVDTVNGLKADLIVITGDLVDGDVCRDSDYCRHLKRLKATHGVVAVTGNHEYFSGVSKFLEMAKEAGITVLSNRHITVGDGLQIIGLEDVEARRFGFEGPDLEKAVAGCDVTRPMILLNHRPLGFPRAVSKGVDLMLAGHTHAGQIPPMDMLVWFYYKYPYGLYELDGSYIYTSPGTGFWGPPMRFLSTNEITRITLTAK
ncbi:MAG: metallophosphoesterase [bacterium]|nr:metallophosphoesterase [bacterium]